MHVSARSPTKLSKTHVLVVDDNQNMRKLVANILDGIGIKNVQTCSTAMEAFAELISFPADLIICDWNMAPVDGVTFIRMVRTSGDSPNKNVPIIMLTGYPERELVIEARDAGADAYLLKPVSPKALQDRVLALIEGSPGAARGCAPAPVVPRPAGASPPNGSARLRLFAHLQHVH